MAEKIKFISAGAGSGKTHRLTQILHQKLSERSVRSSGVLATTFTRKAAAELRERVRSHLLKEKAFDLANAMGEARIGTVNAVCGALLERFAFEAGLSPVLQVIDERQTELFIRHAVDCVLDGPEFEDYLKLVHRLGLDDESAWLKDLKSLVSLTRANDIDVEQLASFASLNANKLLELFPDPTTDDLDGLMLALLGRQIPQIETGGNVPMPQVTQTYLREVRDFRSALKIGRASWGQWVKISKLKPEAGLTAVATPISDLAARVLGHKGLQNDIRDYLEKTFLLVRQVLDAYGLRKLNLGVIDFADQEHLLLKLLDDPEVARSLDEELDLLLVDEFQDTSPIQLALFMKLAKHAKEVYWVGDVKQAIYGFRGSDTALMDAVVNKLTEGGNPPEILGQSHRSRKDLVDYVNAVFVPVFQNLPETRVRLEAVRSDSEEGLSEPSLATWLLDGNNAKKRWTTLGEGIRNLLVQEHPIVERGMGKRAVRYSDITVLVRTNDHVRDLSASLRGMGIPATAADQPGLLATPEAVLLLACLRRLHDANDTLATAEIISLADCAKPETWVSDRLSYLQSGLKGANWLEVSEAMGPAHPILKRLAQIRMEVGNLAPAEILQRIVSQCDLTERVLRWQTDIDLARLRLANLEALIACAEEYEQACLSISSPTSLYGLMHWFVKLADEEMDFLPEPPVDAVRVMTHHKAKGLEWPVVILADLTDDIKDTVWSISAQSFGDLQLDNPLEGRTIRYWPWPFGKQSKTPLDEVLADNADAQNLTMAALSETQRILYVSMTRARDLLVISFPAKKLSGGWIDTLNAPWSISVTNQKSIDLPGGKSLPMPCTTFVMTEPQGIAHSGESPDSMLYWFKAADACPDLLPRIFNPSKQGPVDRGIAERVSLGQGISLRDAPSMLQVGNAIHAAMALSHADPGTRLLSSDIDAILTAHGVAASLMVDEVLEQIGAFEKWWQQRWEGACAKPEYPIQVAMRNGQYLNGRIDLLIETPTGWILIDHKANLGLEENLEELAKTYGAQLQCYAEAIEKVTRKPVVETWLNLPVAGKVIRLADWGGGVAPIL